MQVLPIVAVNGVIGAQVSPLDRGFTYGDGVFETCKLKSGKIPLWDLHRERLLKSCERLSIPMELHSIESQMLNVISTIDSSLIDNAVIKITITRGQGGRGYRSPNVLKPTVVIGFFPSPSYPPTYFSHGIEIRVCHQRLGCNSSLAGLKHLNRLEQILARAEWQDESIPEGVMLDTKNNVIEAVFSNIFVIRNAELQTPDLSQAGVAGIMRRFILETIAPQASLKTHVKELGLNDLANADEIFLCNSLYGIWPVRKLVHEKVHLFESNNVTAKLQTLLRETCFSR